MEDENFHLAKKLLGIGVDMNQPNHLGRTILQEAIARNSIDQVSFYLQAGMSVVALTSPGRTPLFMAIMQRSVSLCEIVFDAGGPSIFSDASVKETYRCTIEVWRQRSLAIPNITISDPRTRRPNFFNV